MWSANTIGEIHNIPFFINKEGIVLLSFVLTSYNDPGPDYTRRSLLHGLHGLFNILLYGHLII